MSHTPRVRFAPSPTGYMHLGSVRIALINYLFARKHHGSFVLRVEDTDNARNLDAARKKIVEDLYWLGLTCQEGPHVGGSYGPYNQSERDEIYQAQLKDLMGTGRIYRCFCRAEDLEAKRQKQIAMGKPPRYDRTCALLSEDKCQAKIAANLPFVWRFKLNYDQQLDIHDLARGKVSFDMKHFSDFALTRPDGTCTFMFANFVDDWKMKITHVIRGEDHLSNTALQAALYDAFAVKQPLFWHLQIICNKEGAKLSKRDFGFSLEDLKQAGYLPEAILNYMGTVGASWVNEIQSVSELAKNYNFETIHHTGSIRYDVDKLNWFNHKWLNRLDDQRLLSLVKPLLHEAFIESAGTSDSVLAGLVGKIKGEVTILPDFVKALSFVFRAPEITRAQLITELGTDQTCEILQKHLPNLTTNPEAFLESIKHDAQAAGLKTKDIFGALRYLVTGSIQGIGMHDLIAILGAEELTKRLTRALG